MSFFRSSLFAALLSLLVATGYACDVLDSHCEGAPQEQAHGAKGEQGAEDGGCQCLCHQMFTAHDVEPVRAAPVALVAVESFAPAVEFPEDAVPLGIEYPPQLA